MKELHCKLDAILYAQAAKIQLLPSTCQLLRLTSQSLAEGEWALPTLTDLQSLLCSVRRVCRDWGGGGGGGVVEGEGLSRVRGLQIKNIHGISGTKTRNKHTLKKKKKQKKNRNLTK